jgi:hypothetical protein
MDPSTLTNRAGATIDLTSSTCRFQADDWLGVNVIDQPAVIANATNPAQLKYTFTGGDTARKGQFRARWHVVYSGGAIETFPTSPTDLTLVIY